MPQVCFASAALYFGAIHAMAVIGCIDHAAFADGFIKTWPAAATFKFRIAFEQRVATGGTVVGADLKMFFEGAAPRALGAFHAGDIVYVRRQDLFPFLLGQIQFGRIGLGIEGILVLHGFVLNGVRFALCPTGKGGEGEQAKADLI